MKRWLKHLDDVLRGQATNLSALQDGRLNISVGGLLLVLVVLGAFYGFCMGWFALLNRAEPKYMQVLASAVKVPMLFVLTVVVTFPSLYVFNALVGSRLSFGALVRLLVAALAVMLAVLASFGPITIFFSLTSTSYAFMKLLNVLIFTIAGVLGLAFLLQTLHRITVASRLRETSLAQREQALHESSEEGSDLSNPPSDEWSPDDTSETGPASTGEAGEQETGDQPHAEAESATVTEARQRQNGDTAPAPGALDRLQGHVLGRHEKMVFYCWIVIFAIVGAQMSWILRPFIGAPALPFEWFREREANFFISVWRALVELFS